MPVLSTSKKSNIENPNQEYDQINEWIKVKIKRLTWGRWCVIGILERRTEGFSLSRLNKAQRCQQRFRME
jgi:hypothetical protein